MNNNNNWQWVVFGAAAGINYLVFFYSLYLRSLNLWIFTNSFFPPNIWNVNQCNCCSFLNTRKSVEYSFFSFVRANQTFHTEIHSSSVWISHEVVNFFHLSRVCFCFSLLLASFEYIPPYLINPLLASSGYPAPIEQNSKRSLSYTFQFILSKENSRHSSGTKPAFYQEKWALNNNKLKGKILSFCKTKYNSVKSKGKIRK